MDIGSISEVVGLASSAVGLTGKATATAEAIKKLLTADKQTDNGETAQLLNTLASELTAVNMMNVQISEALRLLSQQLQRQNEFEQEKARYQMYETSQGDIIFQLRDDMSEGQPTHYVCPVCMNRDKLISFVSGDYTKVCQANKNHLFRFEHQPPINREPLKIF
jgi:hypothetical protein